MNSASNASITENIKTILACTLAQWSCAAQSTHKEAAKASALASITAPGDRAEKKDGCSRPA